jgi:hypothetical protein
MNWKLVSLEHWLRPLTGYRSRPRPSRPRRSYRPEIDSLEQRILMAGNLTVLPSLLAPAPGSPIAVGSTPDSILAARLDNSGTPYLVAANYYGNSISVLRGDATGVPLPEMFAVLSA